MLYAVSHILQIDTHIKHAGRISIHALYQNTVVPKTLT